VNQAHYRLHRTPSAVHINACRPWLEKELNIIQPRGIIALGRTAAQSLLGRSIVLEKERGMLINCRFSGKLLITAHPAAILRMTEPDAAYGKFVEELKQAGSLTI